jgi:hypothetical protein
MPARQEPRLEDIDIDEPDWEPGAAVDSGDEAAGVTDARPPVAETAAGRAVAAARDEGESAGATDNDRDVETGLPSFLDPDALASASAGPTPVRTTQWWWSVLGLLLALMLPAQHFYFKRELYAEDQTLRPWLERVCKYTGCRLPLRRDPARIDIVNRKVVSHPGVPNALLINATFVNHAEFVQPYPVLELLLTDSTGARVAMRRFLPVEYLSGGVDIGAGMTPELPVHLLLEVAEPSQAATSFQFEFM